MIYFVIFCLSGFLFYIGKYVKSKMAKNATYFIAIIIPVIFSAIRGINVGIDTSKYAYPMYQYAKNANHFKDLIGISRFEPAFLLVEYIGAKYLNSFSFVLGVMQLIIDYSFYKVIREKNGDEELAICMMIFYFFIYGSTLNAIRQSVAISLAFLSTYYYTENKYRKAILLLFTSLFFHMTSLIAIVFWIIYSYAENKRVYKGINIIIVSFSFVLSFGWRWIFSVIFSHVSLLNKQYSDYLIYGKAGERNETSIICGIISLMILFLYNREIENQSSESILYQEYVDTKWYKLLMSATLMFLFYQPITEKLDVAARFLLYPQAFMITVYPLIGRVIHFKTGYREVNWPNNAMIFIFFFSIWFYAVIVRNSNGILPYTFRLF